MARFIVIEKATGTVYGDTARVGPQVDVASPADAVCLLDRQSGRAVRGFSHVDRQSPNASYDVYEISQSVGADATGSETEAHDMIRQHGAYAATLVTYNA